MILERMNALDLLADCERESKLIARMLKDSMSSYNRHGDFVVARTACHRLADRLSELIDLEEGEAPRFRAFETSAPAVEQSRTPKEPPRRTQPAPNDDGHSPDASSVAGMILTMLEKQPLASQEIHRLLLKQRPGLQIGTIYTTCSALKKAGKIENRITDDGTDFLTRYHLL